ncbi:Cytochrome P450 71A9 [Bienertia sinuspersici]
MQFINHSSIMLLLLLLLFFATICCLFFLPSRSSKTHNEFAKTPSKLVSHPPGPKGLPIIGNLHQFDPINTHLYFFQLSKKYGPLIYLKLGFVPTIIVSSTKLAKEVLKTQDHVFCSRPSLTGQQKLSYNGLDLAFAPYNEYWREMRKIFVTHLFSSKRVQTFSWIQEEEVNRMIHVISSLSSKSKITNLSELSMTLTNSIICRIGFGKNYSDDEQSTRRFQGLLHETQAMLAGFFFSDYFPFMWWIDKISGASSKLESVFREFDQFYQELIDQHLKSNKQKTKEQQDIIDILLQLGEEQKMQFDVTLDHIKAILMNIFVAGTDTSAITIVWAMTELMLNPNAMRKVQEEVRNLIKEQQSSMTFIQENQLQHLMYLKAVIKETYRLHPATPILVPRQTMQKCTLEGQYQIESKTLVYINAWAIGRDPDCWENPESFQPERFLGSSIDYKGQHFELLPFGAGRRGCPGLLLGATTIELALANLLCFFDWELPALMKREDIDMDVLPGLATHKKIALCLVAKNFIGLQQISSKTNNEFDEKPSKLIPTPGPKGLPIVGKLHQFDSISTHLYFFQLRRKYRPLIYLKLGFVPTISFYSKISQRSVENPRSCVL